ncbi:MAG: hypothetical protein WDZ62_02285 [Candidatus Pacearchaeota archaeon]
MDFKPISLDIDGREEKLSKIKRYVHERFPLMFYRTDDLIHSKRVRYHLEDAAEDIFFVYGKGFDFDYARTLAEVHDDLEILEGDTTLFEKERMSQEELSSLEKGELNSIPKFLEEYGDFVNGYNYEGLLLDAKTKGSIEAKFVSFFDKYDGGGEAWHEVWASNQDFVLPAGGKNGMTGGYIRRLNEFPRKYLHMKNFFEIFPEYLPEPFDFKSAADKGKLHALESLKEDSGFPLYERWKKTIIEREGIENLIVPVEFRT